MAPRNIFVKNHTCRPQSYVLFPDELFILESTKHVLVIPRVEAGKSGRVTVDSALHVWAKLTSESDPVYAEAEAGSVLSIGEASGKLVIKRVSGTPPEDGCFAIATRQNFWGIFGLAVSTPAGFCPITTKQAVGAATYHVEPNDSFDVAVNEKYKFGDEIRDDSTVSVLIKLDFSDGINDVTVNHYDAVAETLRIGDSEEDKVRDLNAELEARCEAVNTTIEMISLLTTDTLDLPAVLGKARGLGVSLHWSEQQKQEFDQKLKAHAGHLLEQEKTVKNTTDEKDAVAKQLAQVQNDMQQLKASSEKQANDAQSELAKEKSNAANQVSELQRRFDTDKRDLDARISDLQAERDALSRRVNELDATAATAKTAASSSTSYASKQAMDLNVLDAGGEFPLYSVAAGGNFDEAKRMLEQGANASMRTRFQWTALHWAVHNGHTGVVQLLLAYGADVNAVSDTGKTPLAMARTEAMRQLLLPRGARY
ncbi:hypothetical protein QBC46DRAFT_359358 [Diplogelasinospora grovesii]|uniref:Ankyrin repeat protein n=1 Tax=Diplogelasinospora grovesii TaxID=303347 RepID=A0AAN6MUW2_9PEZI|nr:hypothetical protein QBC46DRAFT_359358 [Diplogelasinospora grovesii]